MFVLTRFRRKFIGDRAFFRSALVLVLPMVVQNGVSNFVNLLDNVMVGALGTEVISGVAIVNQLIFVFNIMLFGLLAGASIFGAQFYGQGDMEGVRQTFRFKLLTTLLLTGAAILVLAFQGSGLISLFLTGSEDGGSAAVTLERAQAYLRIILWGLIPFGLVQAYSSTLREAGETLFPMAASVIAILVNLVFNYLLIFGKLGFPELGVEGAAIATVLSHYVEAAFLLASSHLRQKKFPFLRGVYRSLYVPKVLLGKIFRTGTPLFLNEVLWSTGTTMINQAYSTRGLSVVAATNIATTAWSLFCIILFSMSSAISIMVGQKLGANQIEEARDVDNKLIFFNVALHCVIGLLVILAAPYIPYLYNTTGAVREMAAWMLRICGMALPIAALYNSIYFTIRCGGKTFITLLFDACFTWVVALPLVTVLCRFTGLDILLIYASEKAADLIRVGIGLAILKSGLWARNLVGEKAQRGDGG